MKLFLLVGLIFGIPFSVVSQNVGIGTAAPSFKFEVANAASGAAVAVGNGTFRRAFIGYTAGDAGYFRTNGANGNANLLMTSNGGNHGWIQIHDDDGNTAINLLADQTDDHGIISVFGANGNLNAQVANLSTDVNSGRVGVMGASGVEKALMFVNAGVGSANFKGQAGNDILRIRSLGPEHGLIQLLADNNQAAINMFADNGTDQGVIQLYGENGNLNVQLARHSSSTNNGRISVMGAAGAERGQMYVDNGIGYVAVQGQNGSRNIVLSTFGGNHGALRIYDDTDQQRAFVSVNPTNDFGIMQTVGANGSLNVELSAFNNNFGRLSVAAATGNRRADMFVLPTNGAGIVRTRGQNNSTNVIIGARTRGANQPNRGAVYVYGETGGLAAGIHSINTTGGEFFVVSGPKAFVEPHPTQPDKDIWYACIEGPEAAAYTRGTAELVNGKATIPFPEHFALLANFESATVTLTPNSADSKGLAKISCSENGLVVQELNNGTGTYTFDWTVMAVRKGQEDFRVIRPRTYLESDKDEYEAEVEVE